MCIDIVLFIIMACKAANSIDALCKQITSTGLQPGKLNMIVHPQIELQVEQEI